LYAVESNEQHNKRKVLGLNLGSNSIRWALMEEVEKRPQAIIDLGCRTPIS